VSKYFALLYRKHKHIKCMYFVLYFSITSVVWVASYLYLFIVSGVRYVTYIQLSTYFTALYALLYIQYKVCKLVYIFTWSYKHSILCVEEQSHVNFWNAFFFSHICYRMFIFMQILKQNEHYFFCKLGEQLLIKKCGVDVFCWKFWNEYKYMLGTEVNTN
jgi:hypothetical protein